MIRNATHDWWTKPSSSPKPEGLEGVPDWVHLLSNQWDRKIIDAAYVASIGVSHVRMVTAFAHIDLYITVANAWDSDRTLHDVLLAVEQVRPVGVSMTVKEEIV